MSSLTNLATTSDMSGAYFKPTLDRTFDDEKEDSGRVDTYLLDRSEIFKKSVMPLFEGKVGQIKELAEECGEELSSHSPGDSDRQLLQRCVLSLSTTIGQLESMVAQSENRDRTADSFCSAKVSILNPNNLLYSLSENIERLGGFVSGPFSVSEKRIEAYFAHLGGISVTLVDNAADSLLTITAVRSNNASTSLHFQELVSSYSGMPSLKALNKVYKTVNS